jgi:exodeoxyribonuclease V beta subunit
MKAINDPRQIDITKHGLIEASAGTGKTYTITHLVKNILISENEPDINSKIIIVTFTEKATLDLRERIRKELEGSISEQSINEKDKIKIKYFLENFQELFISTIHGFCNKILKEYSFENKIPFENELSDDSLIYEKIFNKILKKIWFDFYGDDLPRLIEISEFSTKPESFKSKVFSLTGKYKAAYGHSIIPDTILDKEKISSLLSETEKKIDEVFAIAGKNDIYNEYVE